MAILKSIVLFFKKGNLNFFPKASVVCSHFIFEVTQLTFRAEGRDWFCTVVAVWANLISTAEWNIQGRGIYGTQRSSRAEWKGAAFPSPPQPPLPPHSSLAPNCSPSNSQGAHSMQWCRWAWHQPAAKTEYHLIMQPSCGKCGVCNHTDRRGSQNFLCDDDKVTREWRVAALGLRCTLQLFP